MERKQLESVAAEYPNLRGLFSIPLGLVLIASGLGNLSWGPFSSSWTFFAVVGVAAVAALAIDRYYRENYGRVTLPKKTQVRGLIAAVSSLPLIIGAAVIDNTLDLPIWGFLIAWSLLMMVSYSVSVGLKAHHLVLCGGLLVAGLLPVWGGLSPDMRANAGLMVAGVTVMVSGALDHLHLVKAFTSLETRGLNNGVEA